MRCEEVESKLSAYMDGETDLETSSRVAAHLARCGGCLERLDSIRELDGFIQELPGVNPGAEFTRRVIERIKSLDVEETRFTRPLPGGRDHEDDSHADFLARSSRKSGPWAFLKNFGLSWIPGTSTVESSSAGAFMKALDGLLGLITPSRQSSGTRSLEEFGDFPPCSLGSIYLGLIEQSERG